MIADTEPFRSKVDRTKRLAYWRKDDISRSFYGEIFPFDASTIQLRSETTPCFPDVENCGAVWDARADKFRLFVAADALNARLFGRGRVLAPRQLTSGWPLNQTFDTFACTSWASFKSGACPKYQTGVRDHLSFEVMAPFSTIFDGASPSGSAASATYQSFTEAVVLNQAMNHGAGRERFFFARSGGTYYGLVRWDDSAPAVPGTDGRMSGWKVRHRTIGLNTATSPTMAGFSGMESRASHDSFARVGGLRILTRGDAAGRKNDCPPTTNLRGRFNFVPNTSSWYSNLYDLDGSNALGGGRAGLCIDTTKAAYALTTGSGCPAANQRGSFFVPWAEVWTSSTNSRLTTIQNHWVVLCALDATKKNLYLRTSTAGCNSGHTWTGSFMPYRDCYDYGGRRCNTAAPGGTWIGVCAATQ